MNVTVTKFSGSSAYSEGPYRYRLWRAWDVGTRVLFIMLNPSTADALENDPTIRRCIAFARAWGHGSLEVVNLFAWRSTDPDELARAADAIGPHNDENIAEALPFASFVVAAWGALDNRPPWFRQRAFAVQQAVTRTHDLHAIKVTKGGHPQHPLYIPGAAVPVPFKPRRAA